MNNMRVTSCKLLTSNKAGTSTAPFVALPHVCIQPNAAHQSGAVLAISLIMLLLLTIIGVTATQVTGLEEKMAGNLRNQNLAFQAAEAALRAGEEAVRSGNIGCLKDASLIPSASAILTANPVCSSPVSVSSINYRYIIQQEPPGSSTCPGDTLEGGIHKASGASPFYRITARGTDASNNAVIMLQTIYEKC